MSTRSVRWNPNLKRLEYRPTIGPTWLPIVVEGSVRIVETGNGGTIQRDNGPGEEPDNYGPIFNFRPPRLVDFTTYASLGTTTFNDAPDGVLIEAPPNSPVSTTQKSSLCYKAVSGSSWTLTANVAVALVNPGNAGICVRRADKAHNLSLHGDETTYVLRWTNPDLYGNVIDTSRQVRTIPEWLRIVYDGTNLTFQHGIHPTRGWVTIGSPIAQSTHLGGAPDSVGFFVNPNSATHPGRIWVRHFKLE